MALLGDLGFSTPGYQQRLREGAFTSPSGLRSVFQYAAVRRRTPKRASVYQFADVEGQYIQQHGVGGRVYPLTCYFTGDDHDLLATSFELSCHEDGVGRLEHPLYGVFDVVCTGEVDRRNDLVTAANQSVVEVTFETSLASVYPSLEGLGVNELLQSVDGFNVAAAEQFRVSGQLSSALAQAEIKGTVRALLGDISASLAKAANATTESRRAFDAQQRALNEGLDVLVGQPLELARQITNLIQTPSRTFGALVARLEGYAALAQRILGRSVELSSAGTGPDEVTRAANDFWAADLVATSAMSGALLASANASYRAKPDALAAAAALQSQLDVTLAWRETQIASLATIDVGDAHQAIQAAGAAGVGYLVQQAHSLKPERRVTLDRARTFVDLCFELYGAVDDASLQFFIDSNALTGSEILEIPRGRSVVYYA